MGNVLWCCCKGEDDDADVYGGGYDHYPYYNPTSSRPPSPTPTSSLLRFQSPPAPVSSGSSLLRFQSPPAPLSSGSSLLKVQPPPAPASSGSSILRFQPDRLWWRLQSQPLLQPDLLQAALPNSDEQPPPVPVSSGSSLLRLQSPPVPVSSGSSLLRFQPPQGPASSGSSLLRFQPPPPVPASSSGSSLLRFQSPPAPACRSERQLPHAPLPVPHGVAVASSTLTSSLRRSEPPPVPASRPQRQLPPQQLAPPVTHGVASSTPSVPASRAQRGLHRFEGDLFNFVYNKRVPEGLEEHVTSSKEAQVEWYRNILKEYKYTEPTPETAAEAAMLVATALSGIQRANLEGVLAFYGFPIPTPPVVTTEHHPSSLPEGVEFVRNTLPVLSKYIGDGDGFTAYVDTADPMESKSVPLEVRKAVTAMAQARKCRNEQKKNELRNKLNEAGYRIIYTSKDGILARQYRFRLRGIDAPEMGMQYGKESQNALVKLIAGKSVMVHVYGQDQYKRYVADIYCDGVFIQEQMLKNGHAWHYKNYDKRPDFAKWEIEARDARRGLWASDNPEKPWDWKKRNKRNAATMRDMRTSPSRCNDGSCYQLPLV